MGSATLLSQGRIPPPFLDLLPHLTPHFFFPPHSFRLSQQQWETSMEFTRMRSRSVNTFTLSDSLRRSSSSGDSPVSLRTFPRRFDLPADCLTSSALFFLREIFLLFSVLFSQTVLLTFSTLISKSVHLVSALRRCAVADGMVRSSSESQNFKLLV